LRTTGERSVRTGPLHRSRLDTTRSKIAMTATLTHDTAMAAKIDYRLEHLFTYRLGFSVPPELIGPTPEGLRLTFYLPGGEFAGPRLRGRILPVGGDWLTVRPDGVAILDLRTTFETEDGALIYAPFTAVLDLGPNGYDALLNGRLAPDGTHFRSVPRYSTAHPGYAWLNRVQCLGIGQVFPSQAEARCDVYAVR
jgi:hypothetical protein